MFSSKYGKPFVVAFGIALMMLLFMAKSLEHMGGTGAGNDQTELTFTLDDFGESLDVPDETDPIPQQHGPEEHTAKAEPVAEDSTSKSLNATAAQRGSSLGAAKGRESSVDESRRSEWARQRPIESESDDDGESAVMTHRKSSKSSDKVIGNEVTTDPNATGNGISESDEALSFMSPMALGLLTDGLRDLLRPNDRVNAKEFLLRVQEQGRASSVSGQVVVRVNFGVDGHIIGEPRITDDNVPPAVKTEALRIIQNSGTIINRTGEPRYLAIPVILGANN